MNPTMPGGVTCVPTTSRDNAFLVEGDDGFTLVDVGWAKAPDALARAIATTGHNSRDIRRIVLTHAHPDHVQGAAEMRRRTGATVLIHAADADWLMAGRVPGDGRSGRLGRVIDRIPKLHWAPVSPDASLADGDIVENSNGLRVIHTPGHSPGHIALLHEPSGVLLVGDAIINKRDHVGQGPASLAADPSERTHSLARLPTNVSAIGFAHGAPLVGHAVSAYTDWLEDTLRPVG
jgi:glyoxylase-like metal-dependent hydrolase (beta-lactamase superfamily II)